MAQMDAVEVTCLELPQEWWIPQVSTEFVYHMEDVLDLYTEPDWPSWYGEEYKRQGA